MSRSVVGSDSKVPGGKPVRFDPGHMSFTCKRFTSCPYSLSSVGDNVNRKFVASPRNESGRIYSFLGRQPIVDVATRFLSALQLCNYVRNVCGVLLGQISNTRHSLKYKSIYLQYSPAQALNTTFSIFTIYLQSKGHFLFAERFIFTHYKDSIAARRTHGTIYFPRLSESVSILNKRCSRCKPNISLEHVPLHISLGSTYLFRHIFSIKFTTKHHTSPNIGLVLFEGTQIYLYMN